MDNDNPFRSPLSDTTRPIQRSGSHGAGIWSDYNLLVLRKDAELPDRCIACNEPAEGRRWTQKFYWHSPVFYLLIIVNILIYVLVAVIVRKSAQLSLGICERHQRQRTTALIVGWTTFALAILGFVIATQLRDATVAVAIIASLALFFVGILYAIFRRQLVSPKRIDKNFVWLKGVNLDYVVEYPEWPGVDAVSGESAKAS